MDCDFVSLFVFLALLVNKWTSVVNIFQESRDSFLLLVCRCLLLIYMRYYNDLVVFVSCKVPMRALHMFNLDWTYKIIFG
jgi:hypothetical protein